MMPFIAAMLVEPDRHRAENVAGERSTDDWSGSARARDCEATFRASRSAPGLGAGNSKGR